MGSMGGAKMPRCGPPIAPRRGGRPWALALAAGLGALGGCHPEPAPVEQPMTFNHAVHAEQDLTCLDCHNQADKGRHAATLTIDGCMKCHAEAKDDENPAIQTIRDLRARDQEIPWRWVNRLPGHVYFSHEAHVKYGEMSCQDCHGKVETTTEAFTASQIDHLTMSACIACHEERSVDTDCAACHQ